ncbi:MAG: hypothetical protein IJ637_00410 [Prevotella sp.]|nr:hypothetical protein [Prevotella sp.]
MARYSNHPSLAGLLSGLLLLCLLASCQEGADAGRLFGQWRLGGTTTEYISFSGPLAVFRSSSDPGRQVFGNYQHHGDSLFIQCYSIHGQAADTTLVEDRFGMRPLSDIRLHVDVLAADHIQLSSHGRSWVLHKY